MTGVHFLGQVRVGATETTELFHGHGENLSGIFCTRACAQREDVRGWR